jgi:hypothetical protein
MSSSANWDHDIPQVAFIVVLHRRQAVRYDCGEKTTNACGKLGTWAARFPIWRLRGSNRKIRNTKYGMNRYRTMGKCRMSCINLHGIVFLLVTALVCTNSVIARDSEQVWYWFVSCGGSELTIEAKLDGVTISRTVFPICHALRDSIPVKEPQKTIEFTFRPNRSIVWTGYRDEDDETKANQLINGSFWQAGADPDALLIGVSFDTGDRILMNTIHISYPAKRESSEIAKGLVIVTYPSKGSKKQPK